jgi:hypothetical protein
VAKGPAAANFAAGPVSKILKRLSLAEQPKQGARYSCFVYRSWSGAFLVSLESENVLNLCFAALSDAEPVPTSSENALE